MKIKENEIKQIGVVNLFVYLILIIKYWNLISLFLSILIFEIISYSYIIQYSYILFIIIWNILNILN